MGAHPVGPGSGPGTHSDEDMRVVKSHFVLGAPGGTILEPLPSKRHADHPARRVPGDPGRVRRRLHRIGIVRVSIARVAVARVAIEPAERRADHDARRQRFDHARDGGGGRDPAL